MVLCRVWTTITFTHSSMGCRIGLSSRYNQVNNVVYAGQSLCHGDNFVSSSHQKDLSQEQNKKLSVRPKKIGEIVI